MLDESRSGRYRPLVSVVIKTYDDGESSKRGHDFKQPEATLAKYLLETLDALAHQSLPPYEILIIDCSRGNCIEQALKSPQAAIRMPVRRIVLASEEFSHPRALNLGVVEARGEIVSSLSGDATPADEQWMECLVRHFIDSMVAGSYSRQLQRPGVDVSKVENFRLWWRYRQGATFTRKDPLFSNASSAFRRDLALEVPFDESIPELEDYDWAMRVRDKGYVIVYAGESKVFHSHASSSWQTLRRMVYYTYFRVKLHLRFIYTRALERNPKPRTVR